MQRRMMDHHDKVDHDSHDHSFEELQENDHQVIEIDQHVHRQLHREGEEGKMMDGKRLSSNNYNNLVIEFEKNADDHDGNGQDHANTHHDHAHHDHDHDHAHHDHDHAHHVEHIQDDHDHDHENEQVDIVDIESLVKPPG